jgi:hypothetical protein
MLERRPRSPRHPPHHATMHRHGPSRGRGFAPLTSRGSESSQYRCGETSSGATEAGMYYHERGYH